MPVATSSPHSLNKLYPDAHTALADIVNDDMLLAIGGFLFKTRDA